MVNNLLEPISEHATTRTCSKCASKATNWKYKTNQEGGVNKSSKVAVCTEHSN